MAHEKQGKIIKINNFHGTAGKLRKIYFYFRLIESTQTNLLSYFCFCIYVLMYSYHLQRSSPSVLLQI